MSCCQSPSEEASDYYYQLEQERKQKIRELGGIVKEDVVKKEKGK